MLSSYSGIEGGVTNELFSDEFSELLSDLVSSGGKLKPFDIAALKDLGIENLADLNALAELDLAADSPELKQLSVLSLLANTSDTQIENAELFGNPEINAALKSTLINDELAEDGLVINRDISKSTLSKPTTLIAESLQQSVPGKNTDMNQVLDDINLTQVVKDMSKSDIDFASELLTQAGRQESNAPKLVDQLTSMDKSVNPVNNLNTQSLKSYSGLEQSGKVMNRIEVPVNQAGWGDAVGNRLMMMVNGKIQSANIHLNPAELGPIEIKVNVNQDQATVHFVSNNSSVRDAIEDAFPRLKEMFSQNGLSLADANVSQQSSQQSSKQSEQLFDENNGSSMSSHNEIQEDNDVHNDNANMIDVGLINQYV